MPAQSLLRLRVLLVVFQTHLIIFHAPPQALDKDVVQVAAATVLPMSTPCAFNLPVKASLVNCDPWSVLKIRGRRLGETDAGVPKPGERANPRSGPVPKTLQR